MDRGASLRGGGYTAASRLAREYHALASGSWDLGSMIRMQPQAF